MVFSSLICYNIFKLDRLFCLDLFRNSKQRDVRFFINLKGKDGGKYDYCRNAFNSIGFAGKYCF